MARRLTSERSPALGRGLGVVKRGNEGRHVLDAGKHVAQIDRAAAAATHLATRASYERLPELWRVAIRQSGGLLSDAVLAVRSLLRGVALSARCVMA